MQSTLTQSITTDQQQRTFPPQTLEEFLEQEWELSSDFLLQQTMPHDVSSLLSCLYQFKSENASLQKKFEELKHRRDSLRVTNANLRRRLSEILPINETIPPTSTSTTASSSTATTTATATPTATTISQVSPTVQGPPPPLAPPLVPASILTVPSTILSVVPPSPRKEQQQLKQQKLLAELELQQQLQHQKAISPSRRRLSANTSNQYNESCPPTVKKSKSPRQTNPLTHPSILENQLRQSSSTTTTTNPTIISTNANTNVNSSPNTTKKLNVNPIPSSKKVTTSEIDIISHHQSTSTNPSVVPPTTSSTSTAAAAAVVIPTTTALSVSTPSYEHIDVNAATAAAAAAYALSKNGRAPTSAGLSLELLSQIIAASGTAINSQLFAPTWNISVSSFSFVIKKESDLECSI